MCDGETVWGFFRQVAGVKSQCTGFNEKSIVMCDFLSKLHQNFYAKEVMSYLYIGMFK